jgi:hypothetical protein
MFRYDAKLVDNILRGTRPGDIHGRAADEVRVGHQSHARQGAWPDHAPTLLALADEVIE